MQNWDYILTMENSEKTWVCNRLLRAIQCRLRKTQKLQSIFFSSWSKLNFGCNLTNKCTFSTFKPDNFAFYLMQMASFWQVTYSVPHSVLLLKRKCCVLTHPNRQPSYFRCFVTGEKNIFTLWLHRTTFIFEFHLAQNIADLG